ncbi:unnamed protein product [Penicillium glandicola]
MGSCSAASINIDKPWLLPPQTQYTLTNVKIVDPTNGRLIEKCSVVLSGGRIISIHEVQSEDDIVMTPPSTISDISASEPANLTIDLEGFYLCPGLIDAHVHITATPGEQGLKNTYKNISQSMNNYRTTYVARKMLERGFTTARDCGGADQGVKNAIAEWLILGPRLLIAGHALSQTGGHGDQRDSHVDDDPTTRCCAGHKAGISRLCDGTTECITAVRDEIRKGADFIKIMAGGGVSSKLNNLAHAQFLPEEISAISRTAASFDMMVTAHAYSNRAMRHAVENGARGIEHGNFLDEETAAYLASKDVYFTPTLATYFTLMRSPYNEWITQDSMEKNKKVMSAGLQSLQVAEKAGLTICFGSDLMASMQPFQNNEFSIRAQVQSNLSILRSATVNPARMMGMQDQIGQVSPGLFADLLILSSNPLEDIKVLDDKSCILAVIKEGRRSAIQDLSKSSEFGNCLSDVTKGEKTTRRASLIFKSSKVYNNTMGYIQKKALVIVFPKFNILDLSGPVSVLFNSNFSLTYAAKDELTTSQENATVKRDISLAEAKLHMSDYDILIVPGSRPKNILPNVEPGQELSEVVEFVTSFASHVDQETVRQRTILAVCIGVYFLAFAGLLDGLTATTHRLAVPGLRDATQRYVDKTPGAKGTRVVPEDPSDLVSYLDAGQNQFGVRIITTGAMINGIDAALHFVSIGSSKSAAIEAGELIGHRWKDI